jgi:hypothetical protein
MTYEERIARYGEGVLSGEIDIENVPVRYRKDVENWIIKHEGVDEP